jgi:hypothetical protein
MDAGLGPPDMDGRLVTVLATFALPAVLIGVTVWKFGSNPVALMACVTVMIAGGLYLLTYPEIAGTTA